MDSLRPGFTTTTTGAVDLQDAGKTVVLLGKDKGEANEEGVFGESSDVTGKGEVYKKVVKPAFMYGLKMVALIKRHLEVELEVAELKILAVLLDVTRTDTKKENETTNEYYVIHLAVQKASAPVILSEILILILFTL